ncbi:sporulation protein Cse60 [Borrelia sp. RT5S]|uniref:sporulation protein Cse60 n=1 Tax=Borrelia sp. RT5S TaxID=2898581 RepID=UPI001E50B73B|nr:sporulation protein Cse60 [Borrelia sp. RT5S]UGQ16600.1 sporulation protein Cse60 [Borrelia sp. RT5S]UGQ16632.1 sporulation protein Cse60 [Borrelia sp. RT5S]
MRVMATGGFNTSQDLEYAINQIIKDLEHDGKQVINIKYAISTYSSESYANELHYALIIYK